MRAGEYLRSDAPQPGDRATFVPRTVVDLRSRDETRGLDHPLAAVAEVHEVPLGVSLAPDVVAATPAGERDLAWAYRLLVTEAARAGSGSTARPWRRCSTTWRPTRAACAGTCWPTAPTRTTSTCSPAASSADPAAVTTATTATTVTTVTR
ncbi:tyrosine-protein phosphatase [Pseudonocardia sp. RS11V-5]|nr:tyrosine-protein phosphatase [Pseudonocardia terrae]